MSALTNDPFTLARFAGLYKAVQSAVSLGSSRFLLFGGADLDLGMDVWLLIGFCWEFRNGCCLHAIP